MNIKECIDIVDSNKPNQYTVADKVRWLSFIDEKIINDVLKTHEGYDGRYDDFTGYSDEKLSVMLIAPSPYDRLYTQYLKMKIDEENGETARYNNSAILFNSYYDEYNKWYNKHHMPLTNVITKTTNNKFNQTKGLSDAEMENLKNELTYILTEYFSNTISNDKVYDVVTKYMQTNVQMLKGKDGKTPIKGQDYFTEADVKAIMDELTKYAKGEVQNMSRDFEIVLTEIHTKFNALSAAVKDTLPKKVDKISGMGLSEVNYTTNDQQMIYDNNRQIDTLKQNMTYKVDAVPGKGLSSNDYTTEEKKLLSELSDKIKTTGGNKPGQITESGGEIFNDYEENEANAQYTAVFGKGNKSGENRIYDVSLYGGVCDAESRFINITDSETLANIKAGDDIWGEAVIRVNYGGFSDDTTVIFDGVRVETVESNGIVINKSLYGLGIPLGDSWSVKSQNLKGGIICIQSVDGKYNDFDGAEKYLHITGNGTSDEKRSNAYTLDRDGVAWFKGGVKVGGTCQGDGVYLGGGELESLGTFTLEEEINNIEISADTSGNPFELKELFAYIQIPAVTEGIQPIIYFGSENSCNRTLDNLTNDSSVVIRWKREEGIAEIQTYNYGTNKFKSLTILNVADTNIVNKLRLYHKTKSYPIGTSIMLKGKRV